MEYPKKLLDNVSWKFNEERIDLELYNQQLIEYNIFLDKKIDPYQIILYVSKILIIFSYDDELDENTISFGLDSDNKTGFCSGELLYKIQNEIAPKVAYTDFKFFEGLIMNEIKTLETGIPSYSLILGS